MNGPRVSGDVLLHIMKFIDVITLGKLRLLNKETLHLINVRELSICKCIASEQGWNEHRISPLPSLKIRRLHALDRQNLAREVVFYLQGHAQRNAFCPLRHEYLEPWSYTLRTRLESGLIVLLSLAFMRPKAKTHRPFRPLNPSPVRKEYDDYCYLYLGSLSGATFFNFQLLLLLLRCTIINSSERCDACRKVCNFHSERCLGAQGPPSNPPEPVLGASPFGSGLMQVSGVTAKRMAEFASTLPDFLAITHGTKEREWLSFTEPPALYDINEGGVDHFRSFLDDVHWCKLIMGTAGFTPSSQPFFERSWRDFYRKDRVENRVLRAVRRVFPREKRGGRERNLWG